MNAIGEKALFEKAIDIGSDAERSLFLENACGSDLALRERVENLLRAYYETGFLEKEPSMARSADVVSEVGTAEPESVGPYRIVRRVGDGGFGAVYEAVQESPIKRRVALKMIKLGMDTEQIIRRFEVERQILALMEHPGIARVYDAGATEAGRPYFVMEFVAGGPITTYCDERQLDIPSRLRLFGAVCKAIQHAHQKGIIHRDIKPSNVLIAEGEDASPALKIIDFGIARAMETGVDGQTLLTRNDQFIGTPAYVSPEHAAGIGTKLDTRSDIYSLGVLLCELLTGHAPFETEDLYDGSLETLRRNLREKPTPKPSDRLAALDAKIADEVAKNRSCSDETLRQTLRGELDWVVHKAIAKDPDERYQDAGAFHSEIERFLTNRPVEARPQSFTYRSRKFLLRNARRIAVAGGILSILVGGFAWTNHEQRAQKKQFAVESVFSSETVTLPAALRAVATEGADLAPRFRERLHSESLRERRRARLGIYAAGEKGLATEIVSDALTADAAEFAVYAETLKSDRPTAVDSAVGVVQDRAASLPLRLRAAALVAKLDPLAIDWEPLASVVSSGLTTEPALAAFFVSVRPPLESDLVSNYESGDTRAGQALALLFHDELDRLVRLITHADQQVFSMVVSALQENPPLALNGIANELSVPVAKLRKWGETLETDGTLADESVWEKTAVETSRLLIASAALDHWDEILQALREYPPADPSLRTAIIHGFAEYGIPHTELLRQLEDADAPGIRHGLLSALGDFSLAELPVDTRGSFLPAIKAAHADPDPGLHAIAAWLVHTWNLHAMKAAPVAGQRWRISGLGHTMIRFPASEARIGSPVKELGRGKLENFEEVSIPPFEIANTPVTFREFHRFRGGAFEAMKHVPEKPKATAQLSSIKPFHRANLTLDCPLQTLSFQDFRAYCNWLTREEFGPDAPLCYVEEEVEIKGKLKMLLEPVDGYLELEAYRLPTDSEWEFACRAGSLTRNYTGTGVQFLHRYEWLDENSEGFGGPPGNLRPNLFGMHDMLGNIAEMAGDTFLKRGEDELDSRYSANRGTNFWRPANSLRSARRNQFPIRIPQVYLQTPPTFRVARTTGKD